MRACLIHFARDTRGAATFLMLYLVGVVLLVGGFAMDFANRYRVESALQSAADMAAANAAVRLGEPRLASSPRMAADRSIRASFGTSYLIDAWQPDSFELGHYDPATAQFTISEKAPTAVRVSLARSPEQGNGERTLLLGMIGLREWDLRVSAIARTRTVTSLPCPDPILSVQAKGRLLGQSAFAGICLTGGVTASTSPLPDWLLRDGAALVNDVVSAALPGTGVISAIRFASSHAGADALGSLVQSAQKVTPAEIDPEALSRGVKLHVSCPSGGVMRLRGPLEVNNALVISDCPIRFDADVRVQASLIVSNLAGLVPGRRGARVSHDTHVMDAKSCAPGDGARLYLFANADVQVALPALSVLNPVQEIVDQGALTGLGGRIAANLSASAPASLGQIAGLCIGAEAMISSDRVSLH